MPSLTKKIALKDGSLKFIGNHVPKDLIVGIEKIIEQAGDVQRKYLTIDVFFKLYKEGERTCRDTDWHTDGQGNLYFMYQEGNNRTLFKNGEDSFEIPEGEIFRYSSSDVHRGRNAKIEGRRLMIRLCYSDYLTPKNKRFV